MERTAILLSAIAPALIILGYGIEKGRGSWANEALWTGFFVGAIGALLAAFIELPFQELPYLKTLPPLVAASIKAAVAAIPEEAVKFFVLIAFVERHVDMHRLQDIVIAALGISLGFAALENIFYLFEPGDWKFTATTRALTAVPGHGIDGLVMGTLLIAARLRPDPHKLWFAAALLIPMALHAAYDFPLFAMDSGAQPKAAFAIGWLAVMAVSAVFAVILCDRFLKLAAEADRVSGADSRGPADPQRLIIAGAVLLAASIAVSISAGYFKAVPYGWVLVPLGIVPVILAIDLLWSGLRQSRRAPSGI